MKASGTFKVARFVPTTVVSDPSITTALPVGVAQMEKNFDGEISGRSATLFTAAFDRAVGVGSYVAMESFEGSLNGRKGTFNFIHTASTSGTDRNDEFFVIVRASGTEELTGIQGAGGMRVEPDGTHCIWFDYDFVE
jgi:hypothetical protein